MSTATICQPKVRRMQILQGQTETHLKHAHIKKKKIKTYNKNEYELNNDNIHFMADTNSNFSQKLLFIIFQGPGPTKIFSNIYTECCRYKGIMYTLSQMHLII